MRIQMELNMRIFRAGGRLEKSIAAKMAPQPARQPAIADFSAVSGKKKKNANLPLKKKN